MMMRNGFSESPGRFFSRHTGFAAAALLALAGTAHADQSVSLQWNANSDTNTAGYYLYFGNSSTNFSNKIDVGNNTMATITGLTGKSAVYYFAATAYNSNRMESPPSNQAQFTTSSNSGPTLAAIPSVSGNINSLMVVTNNVSDPDKVAHTLTYSLDPGAPASMRINTSTGLIMWAPKIANGGTTNSVTVRVTDNFGLYSTQTVNVGVSNGVQVSFSPVVVGLGNAASSQLSITCTTPVTNVTFVLDAPTNRVSNLTLQNLIPSVANITQSPAGSTHSTVTISALSGQSLNGTLTVAQLNFTAVANLPSTFSANAIGAVAARQSNGQAVPVAYGCNGDLVLVGAEPLVRSIQSNSAPALILYGAAGKTFQIQSSTNPTVSTGWSAFLTSGVLGTNLTQVFTNVPASSTPKFYRILAL